ncbi:MAG TPA: flagellar biosynthesis protein FlgM [Sulfurimonas sp. UBA12504]|nr:MAG TPA: flagellar biosynthesis protein FlgM [Sulfurimonas sp. UBA12504]
MISQANSSTLQGAYVASVAKDVKKASVTTVNKQGDTSKIEQIKEAINSGEYKVDLQALSEKIAQELL